MGPTGRRRDGIEVLSEVDIPVCGRGIFVGVLTAVIARSVIDEVDLTRSPGGAPREDRRVGRSAL